MARDLIGKVLVHNRRGLRTSGVIIAPSQRPAIDTGTGSAPAGRTHTMCSAAGANPNSPGAPWCVTGCMLAAGGSLKWLRDSMFPGVSYEQLDAEAALAIVEIFT